jgi:hypothetical protein
LVKKKKILMSALPCQEKEKKVEKERDKKR